MASSSWAALLFAPDSVKATRPALLTSFEFIEEVNETVILPFGGTTTVTSGPTVAMSPKLADKATSALDTLLV